MLVTVKVVVEPEQTGDIDEAVVGFVESVFTTIVVVTHKVELQVPSALT